MLTKEAVTNLLLKTTRFATKRGANPASNREFVDALNGLFGEEFEKPITVIYINPTDNFNIPDVTVFPVYRSSELTGFYQWLFNPDESVSRWGGSIPSYSIEIAERCFDKFTEEELLAVIIHHLLQIALSDTMRTRFLKAYTRVVDNYRADAILDLFNTTPVADVMYLAYLGICLRPFQVPAGEGEDHTGVDDVLVTLGLADAYDSYLNKTLPMSNDTVTGRMDLELKKDYRDMAAIFQAWMDNDLKHYYTMIREGIPLRAFQFLTNPSVGNNALGYSAMPIMGEEHGKKLNSWERPKGSPKRSILTESFNNPNDEIDIRYQIDKVINTMRYAESEAEREVILFKIKQLTLKLASAERAYSKRADRGDTNAQRKVEFLQKCLTELDELRSKTVHMEIKTKHWHVYVKDAMPSGYDF